MSAPDPYEQLADLVARRRGWLWRVFGLPRPRLIAMLKEKYPDEEALREQLAAREGASAP